MKDFIIAEYKTIILVLLFCGGVFAWFYHRELEVDAAKEAAKSQSFSCMEPGKWLGTYKLGDPAPAFDDSWEETHELTPDISSWHHNGGDLVVNVQKNIIRSVEIYPSHEMFDKCQKDFNRWITNHPLGTEPITLGTTTYSRYPGVVSITQKLDDETKNTGWIVMSVLK